MSVDNEPKDGRRKFLKAAIGGATLLSGCTGGGQQTPTEGGGGQETTEPGTETETTAKPQAEPVDSVFDLPIRSNLDSLNLNIYNVQPNGYQQASNYLLDQLNQWIDSEAKWRPLLATDWSGDKSGITINLHDGYTWWPSGDQLTAKDVVSQFRLDKLTGAGMWSFTKSVSAEDDFTVRVNFKEGKRPNPNVSFAEVFGDHKLMGVKRSLYKEPLQRMQDATTKEERNSVKSFLLKDFKIDEPYGNGMFEVTKVSSQRIVAESRDEYPHADINFGLEATNYADEQAWYQAAIADKLDTVFGVVGPKMRNALPDDWREEWVGRPAGSIVAFGPKSKDFGPGSERNRAKRHAVAYICSLDQFMTMNGQPKPEFPMKQACMPASTQPTFIKDNIFNAMIDHKLTTKPGLAEEVLKKAGFSKQKDWWHRPDGTQFKTSLKAPANWSGNIPGWKAQAQLLTDAGIKTKFIGVENSTFFGQTTPNHDFELAIAGVMNADPNGYPYFSFWNNMGSLSSPPFVYNNELETLTVPWPPGSSVSEYNPDAEKKEINVNEKIKELAVTQDEKRAQKLIHQLSWAHNTWMQFYRVTEASAPLEVDAGDWSWAQSGDPAWTVESIAWQLKTGQGKAKTK